jgi:hypothetical protein
MLVQKAILLGSSATTAASVGGVAALLVRLSGCQAASIVCSFGRASASSSCISFQSYILNPVPTPAAYKLGRVSEGFSQPFSSTRL